MNLSMPIAGLLAVARRCGCQLGAAALALPSLLHAQQAEAPSAGTTIESIWVFGNWLGVGQPQSVKNFPGARTVLSRGEIEASGADRIDDVMRRIPGVQATGNSGTAGSLISLNVGVRGLTGRYSPRSTVLLDGVPLAVAPYGQPQLSFAPVSLNNIETIDVVRGGGSVRYGPQNIGGIINFKTRPVPRRPGLSADVSVRRTEYAESDGRSTQLGVFLGTQLDSGLGYALLYSGASGSAWRAGAGDRFDDLALKVRYDIGPNAEVHGKVAYYRVRSQAPGGLTVAQFDADPFQNTRPTDFWTGERTSVEAGYVNNPSTSQEFEVRTYLTKSTRESALVNAAATQLAFQPRNYNVLGIEPSFVQRVVLGKATHDVRAGYRYLRERGDDSAYARSIVSGATGVTTRFDNATDAHSVYIDDRIAIGAWRITPGVRFERIKSLRKDLSSGQAFETRDTQTLPSIHVAHLLTPALTLYANHGTSFGAVQNVQLNSQSSQNPLQPELAKTTEFGARWRNAPWRAELTLFQIRFNNQIQQVAGVTPVLFGNVGATRHDGLETSADYTFTRAGWLAGLQLFANFSVTRATQRSGPTAGLHLPFYSRVADTVGARYEAGAFSVDLSSTHQSAQFSDNANTETETDDAGVGRIPGFRLWNAQVSWKLQGTPLSVRAGLNNLRDRRYYTRNVDSNQGRMVGPPRTFYVLVRVAH
jgi:Fe(3+) dicitrate transport protein